MHRSRLPAASLWMLFLFHVQPVAATSSATVAWVTTTAVRTVLPTVTTDLSVMRLILVQQVVAINCGADVCVAGCDSRAECDPGGYGEFADKAKCPLNVCCSKFGFCGTTKEFCGTKTVKRPSCSKDSGLSRVVGYYEGWSMRRPCHSFYPEQIPVGVYTHLNYAFASIDPETFEVLPPSSQEKDLMKRLTALKRSDPDLKVYIAVGGWTFNDPGPTATVFSDIAGSEANQKAFFKSLISFMSTYDFDGIDLDWEYPVADDRSGRPEDYKNFPSFIANLKRTLKASGGRDGLSITLPASYWYLQHFDIIKLQKDVDFFNIMSYDLHGAWDRNNQWLLPVLNSHTNLTEITNALDLLWRNDIEPEKVVLGLAFYACVFSATSPSCMEPGCTFESGGNAGACSNEVGILLNSEIVDIMDDRQVKPTVDKDAAVKILKFDNNQWLTYDDADTFKLKADFARRQCLGGVMVWAVSHDLPYGNYSRALAEVANRKVKAIAMSATTDELKTRKVHQQCKWTNCFENCPAGWTLIARSDGGEREGEGMVDNTSCGRHSNHLFCCPPDAPLPTCGWYGHRNGKCDGRGKCPANTVEVGSNGQHCNNNNYQAACCTFDTPSMKLYSQCTWAESPKCEEGVCLNSLVAESSTGSGGDYCRWKTFRYTWNGQEATYQERKYCCDEKDDTKWEDCEWFDNVGIFPADSAAVEGYCASGCPSDRVRVALETRNGCEGDGGRVRCCKPKYTTVSKRSYTDPESRLEQSVKEFMAHPSCGIDDYWKRDLAVDGYLFGNVSDEVGSPSALVRRASSKAQEDIQELLSTLLLSYTVSEASREIWKKHVVSLYPNLTVEKIRAYMTGARDWVREGTWRLIDRIICNMAIYNSELGDVEPIQCPIPGGDWNDPPDEELAARYLDKRSARTFTHLIGGVRLPMRSLPYRTRGQWPRDHPIWRAGYGFRDNENCLSGDIGTQPVTRQNERNFVVEHVPELHTVPDFVRDAHNGSLPSRRSPIYPGLTATFILQGLDAPILSNPPPMRGGAQSARPIVRMMNALGSTRNDGGFVLLDGELNRVKKELWLGHNPYADVRMDGFVRDDNYAAALNSMRAAIAVIHYLNNPVVNSHLASSLNEVRRELVRATNRWVELGNPREPAPEWWSVYVRDHFFQVGLHTHSWVDRWAQEMDRYWAARTGLTAVQVREALRTLRDTDTTINQDDID
ncbi:hypothetical protein CFD26_105658 [Aspergillus turcosus]|uniref:chitinase n=1 Tax=Aspergillus turcosus TaxID=1245748 RepID=A0A421D6D6_9EURO|nr:hypothetical protein CFD26_105658 [Aspergillus turcosus]